MSQHATVARGAEFNSHPVRCLLPWGRRRGVVQWETSQACRGSFGSQKLQTQMWRSLWSGPRGYDNWHGTGLTSNSFIDYGWSTDCNDGGGTYTYCPVMQGYVSGIGWGPKTRSNNDLRKGCGTRFPNP
ncbi:hypothetical protein ACFZDK_23260 [Streptomyces sp. NPDC007901]|uniref:hypothetical protein n=1 Tax=Streptomyces sp. NPDC007901 TaxID=3364785 RepID=UPI0036E1F995